MCWSNDGWTRRCGGDKKGSGDSCDKNNMLEERLVGYAGRKVVDEPVKWTLRWVWGRKQFFSATAAPSRQTKPVQRKNHARWGSGRDGRRCYSYGTFLGEILGKCKGAELLLIILGDFPDADSAYFTPRSCDAFGPFQNIYEANGACPLQSEWLR
jgi:hypothetical protein